MSTDLPRPKDLSLDAYAAIEEGLLSTQAGRAFLRMRDRRAASVGMAEFHTAFDRLRHSLDKQVSSNRETGNAAIDAVRTDVLRIELLEMAGTIRRARTEIRAMKPPDGTNPGSLDTAVEELDAIVRATESATTNILNGAERIMDHAQTLRTGDTTQISPICNDLDQLASDIMLSCSFQDITGQRISKVVQTVRLLEERVHTLLRITENWGAKSDFAQPDDEVQALLPQKTGEAALMNGPALHGGIDQGEVDRLFGGGTPQPEPIKAPSVTPPPPAPVVAAPPPPPPPPPPAAAPPAAAMDQSAIDALFG